MLRPQRGPSGGHSAYTWKTQHRLARTLLATYANLRAIRERWSIAFAEVIIVNVQEFYDWHRTILLKEDYTSFEWSRKLPETRDEQTELIVIFV
jgi:hypothetical protein